MRNALVMVGIGAIVLAGGWWYLSVQNTHVVKNDAPSESAVQQQEQPVANDQGAAIGDENLVTFRCAESKSITAVFERDIIALTLSDGRQMTLRQATAASGVRYVNSTGSTEFRGKGDEGFLIENGNTTYASCKAT